jgi:hypothetical protein
LITLMELREEKTHILPQIFMVSWHAWHGGQAGMKQSRRRMRKMNNLENKLLNLVAGVSPWLAPLIPTYYAAYNAYHYLAKGRDWWDVAMIVAIALVVEFIGLAGVHTAIQFWTWNRTKLKTDDAAPLQLSILAVVFYVTVVIVVNAMLDYFAVADPGRLPYVKIVAVALLSLLALNSALIVALRAGQAERERKAEESKTERSNKRVESYRKVSEEEKKVTGNFPNDWRKARLFMSEQEVREICEMQTADIVKKYHLASDKSARNWRDYARAEMAWKEQGDV